MADDLALTNRIIDLLSDATSLNVVSEFLKKKSLTFSAGSWNDMREKRLLPAISNNQITNLELIDLLRGAEESGNQHIFLYQCSKEVAQNLMERARVSAILRSKGLERLLDRPDVLGKPASPQIVDVRWTSARVDLSLTIKQIELRIRRKFLRDEVDGEFFRKIYTNEEQRAVNLARLHRDGLLEIRIKSHVNSSKYDGDVFKFRRELAAFLPINEFREVSLTTAKDTLWRERLALRDMIRYTDATVKNAAGNSLRAVTGSDVADLSDDDSIGSSVDRVMSVDSSAYCEDANLYFRKVDGLSGDVHVLLDGEVNEFALPANCTEEEYNYVLGKIRFFNR